MALGMIQPSMASEEGALKNECPTTSLREHQPADGYYYLRHTAIVHREHKDFRDSWIEGEPIHQFAELLNPSLAINCIQPE
mmetsp:Transcript_478/g.706  ORF Transcript_478/g.706 Transcript_478/m.706 type:complete len:81 (+) Transcript_478:72-314(+)